MVNVATALGVLFLIGIGIVINKADRRAAGPQLRPHQAVKLARTNKGTQFLNQLSVQRDRGVLLGVALAGGGTAGDELPPVGIEPVFLAAGTSTTLIEVDAPAGLPAEMLRGGLAGDTSREGDAAIARGLAEFETVVLNLEQAPVTVADSSNTTSGVIDDSAPASTAPTVATADASREVMWRWTPPLAAGH